MIGNSALRFVLIAPLVLSLHVSQARAAAPALLGTAEDWVVRTASEDDRVSVTPAAASLAGLSLSYVLSAGDSWVSARRLLPRARDFSRDEGFSLRVFGDQGGAQLHVDLVAANDEDFLRWSGRVNWHGWRDLWIGQDEFETHGTPTLSQIAAVRLSIEANGPDAGASGTIAVSEWRASDPPPQRRRQPAILFNLYGHEPVRDKHLYITGRDMEPILSRHQYLSVTRLRVVPKSDEPVFIHLLWRAPGLGRVMAYADHGGRGFTAGSDHFCLNLCLVETKVRQLSQRLNRWSGRDYSFSDELVRRTAEIEQSWARIRSTEPHRWADVASEADRIMGAAGCALETVELEKARTDIERYGQRELEVVLHSRSGQSVDGYRVTYRQVRRDFLMGVHPLSELTEAMQRSERIRETAPAAFNLGLVPLDAQFHGTRNDSVDPQLLWEQNQALLALHRRLGLVPRGSICPFFTPGCASWMRTLPFDDMLKRLARAVAATVERFRDEIDIWLVINEAHDWANSLNLSHAQQVEVTRTVVDAAHEADPGCTTIVNACLPWGEYVHWWQDDTKWTPFAYFQALNRAGVRYDVIGLQVYTGFAEIFPLRDLADMSEMLDRYATLGKPIFITEVCVPSRGTTWGSWHGDEWDLQRHADYVEGLYTLAHGKPFVDAIRWFSFSDRQFTNDTGLVGRSLDQVKPAYERVIQLAQRWTTAREGTTGTDGVFRFRGYLGDYEVSVIRDGAPVATQTVHLSRGTGPQRVVVSVP